MTKDVIKKLRELEAKATPGPWSAGPLGLIHRDAKLPPLVDDTGMSSDDRDLIVAARNALPELLDEVERLREIVAAVTDANFVRQSAERQLNVERLRAALEVLERAFSAFATTRFQVNALEQARAALEGKP